MVCSDILSFVKAAQSSIQRKSSLKTKQKKSYLTLNTWAPIKLEWIYYENSISLPLSYHSQLKWKYSGLQSEFFVSISHLALRRRHNVEVTHCGGTHTIRGGRSKYSIKVLAGADDNLGPNLRQLSASVAWHPVLWGGFSYSSIAPYLSLFFASDSPYRGCMQGSGRM